MCMTIAYDADGSFNNRPVRKPVRREAKNMPRPRSDARLMLGGFDWATRSTRHLTVIW